MRGRGSRVTDVLLVGAGLAGYVGFRGESADEESLHEYLKIIFLE